MENFQPKTCKRNKYWVTEFYPESLDLETVVAKINELHINAFISPCHELDVNPDGEPKKPHYHVILIFDSLKSREQAQECVDFIGTVGCFYCTSFRGYSRYLCHLDNPEKASYDVNLVTQIGDCNYFDVIASSADKIELMGDICEFCFTYEIFDFWYIVLWSYHEHRYDWVASLTAQTLFYRSFLQSMEYSYKKFGSLTSYEFNLASDLDKMKKLRERERQLESAKLALQDKESM